MREQSIFERVEFSAFQTPCAYNRSDKTLQTGLEETNNTTHKRKNMGEKRVDFEIILIVYSRLKQGTISQPKHVIAVKNPIRQ